MGAESLYALDGQTPRLILVSYRYTAKLGDLAQKCLRPGKEKSVLKQGQALQST